ncbi:hypothetical protein ACFHYJ_00895 [Pasteurella multocida]
MKTAIQNGKVYNEQGEVAVLYSPEYGAGWSTWNGGKGVFTPEIVQLVLDEAPTAAIMSKAREILGEDFYLCGARNLKIEWLKPGTQFYIDEYDGYESVNYSPTDILTA